MAVVSALDAMNAVTVLSEEVTSERGKEAVITVRLYLRQQRSQSQKMVPAMASVAMEVDKVQNHAQRALDIMAGVFPGSAPDPSKPGGDDGEG